jgi:hypothetical protein
LPVAADVAVHQVDRGPVRDDDAGELELPLEHGVDQISVTVQLLAVEAAERDHDRADAALDGLLERRQMDRAQLGLADPGIAPVDSAVGPAVCEIVLRGGQHRRRTVQCRTLQAIDPGCHRGHQFRCLAEGFIGSPPVVVTGHAQAGGEVPVDARAADLFGGGSGDVLDEARVSGGPEADVVREDGRALDVVVPVHGVDAVHDRDPQRRAQG